LDSGAVAILLILLTVFVSDFFVVTGAFDCTDFSVAFDNGFAGVAAGLTAGDFATAGFAEADFAGAVFAAVGFTGADVVGTDFAVVDLTAEDDAVLLTGLTVAFPRTSEAPAGFPLTNGLAATTGFFGAAFAVDLDAAGFTFFAGSDWVFAGFFIAFAMESTTN